MNGERLRYEKDGWVCEFDRDSGRLRSVGCRRMRLPTADLALDVGIDERFCPGRLKYRSLDGRNTWELPPIVPAAAGDPIELPEFLGCEEERDLFRLDYRYGGMSVQMRYRVIEDTLEVDAVVRNLEKRERLINGAAFVWKLEPGSRSSEMTFEFPGNVPHREFAVRELSAYQAIEAGLVNPVVQAGLGDERFNLLFVDTEEKWSTGLFKEADDSVVMVQNAGVECLLGPEESIRVGTLYVQLIGTGDPYEPVRRLYERKGWVPPSDGIRDGVLYACHPYGTMDAGFPDRRSMGEFAETLPELRRMGIEHVWVLPIFEHLERGVYHPTDQSIIDPRYGHDEDVRVFSRTAHELGMTVLFDYVPHGPEPEDPLGIRFRKWASVDRQGDPAIEWNCLSFDMANPEYLAYIRELVQDHVDRFDIDGSRIDCAMGGLSNYRPYPGNRASSSNLKGGVGISRTVREAIRDKGKKPLVTPENFNPVPLYAPYTDVFYDMALYRVLFELTEESANPATMARRLTRWLDSEMRCTPKGYLKLRFLGNHDTVTWVWHGKRATEVFGAGLAKALWVLMSTIDGIPMIYQGDEDASVYRRPGPDLRPFFTELFRARKIWLDNDYDVRYLKPAGSVMAYTRSNGAETRLIAVNLSGEPATIEAPASFVPEDVLFGRCETDGRRVLLDGYGYAMLDIHGQR
ncbi:alpha-amylase family glycosyl hydrolase [Cohnella zeiphila]|uniref:Glycosyl hydrolase family 13 catalytic domain-containing protein n=1 Tax=Cohnella zeiphila TaxID=2761120 RepID=A0A7X0SQ65_9BACL|nr:alpha-amylase family glycosyl hydrolase [Cohnella zeiphila]MBB6734112.1 hypothetical protein [Cohnella zeiphila]